MLAAAAALALLVVPGAAARTVVETAKSGDVVARLSFAYNASTYRFSRLHVTISRGGAIVVDTPLRPLPPPYYTSEIIPEGYSAHRKSIFTRDLDGDGEPEVYLELYSGAAHCCDYTQVYRYVASAEGYSLRTHVWGNVGVFVTDLNRDRVPEFESADDRFSYEFTDFADSSWPVQIWAYRNGDFTDVTRQFPAVIAADARRQWRYAFGRDSNGPRRRGVLAAWAADECLLRRCGEAFRRLETLRKKRRLDVRSLCPCDRSARAYLLHLRRFLRRTGYL